MLDDRVWLVLARAINRGAIKYNFSVQAYVFMAGHVHLLIHPLGEAYAMEAILKAIKQGPSQIAKHRNWIDDNLWERGGGFDSNITGIKARQEITDYINQNPVRKGIVEDPISYRWSSCHWFVTDEPRGSQVCPLPKLVQVIE